MKYSDSIKEKAKRLSCEHGSLEKVAKIKDMPSLPTLQRWCKAGKWDLTAKKTNEIAVGRERRFKSCEQLSNELSMYFNSLWEEVWDLTYLTGVDGKETTIWIPRLDMNLESIYRLNKNPTITGICLSLKISKTTWKNYLDGKFDNDLEHFSEVIAMAKLEIEEYNFQQAYDTKKCKGALWVLERQFKYTQRVENDDVTDKPRLEDYFADEN